MFISGVNQSMNRINDIDDPIEKANSVQQLHPITSFATVALNLETNPEILDNMSSYIGCSMEGGARELARLLHNKANELREKLYKEINKNKSFDAEILQYNQFVNSSGEVIEERSKQR